MWADSSWLNDNVPTEEPMDEIQLFKLMMERELLKREEEKKKSKNISLPVLLDNGVQVKHWYG